MIILSSFLLIWLVLLNASTCPETGVQSLAPINFIELGIAVKEAISDIKGPVIYTTINTAAAKHNLLPFLQSLALTELPLLGNALIGCFDKFSRISCSKYISPKRCLLLVSSIPPDSLTPGGKKNDDYWKLTFSRLYVLRILSRIGVDFLSLDVDSVLLKNPFSTFYSIGDQSGSIAVVEDVAPLDFSVDNNNGFLNGGFVFVPHNSDTADIIGKLWSHNCISHSNDQLILTNLLREKTAELRQYKNFSVNVLSTKFHKNFCNSNCGASSFHSISSFIQLVQIEKRYNSSNGGNNSRGGAVWECALEHRQQWVFFHVACLKWPDAQGIYLAKYKGKAQYALLDWLKPGWRNSPLKLTRESAAALT